MSKYKLSLGIARGILLAPRIEWQEGMEMESEIIPRGGELIKYNGLNKNIPSGEYEVTEVIHKVDKNNLVTIIVNAVKKL